MKRRHILIVDDDARVAGALKDHLKQHGFRVTLVGSCEQGQDVLAGKSPVDLMIMDGLLPDGKGKDLLEAAAHEDRLQKPPVIMSSSLFSPSASIDSMIDALSPASQSLVQACLPKPCNLEGMDTLLHLVFELSPSTIAAKTFLGGDYRDPLPKSL